MSRGGVTIDQKHLTSLKELRWNHVENMTTSDLSVSVRCECDEGYDLLIILTQLLLPGLQRLFCKFLLIHKQETVFTNQSKCEWKQEQLTANRWRFCFKPLSSTGALTYLQAIP